MWFAVGLGWDFFGKCGDWGLIFSRGLFGDTQPCVFTSYLLRLYLIFNTYEIIY